MGWGGEDKNSLLRSLRYSMFRVLSLIQLLETTDKCLEWVSMTSCFHSVYSISFIFSISSPFIPLEKPKFSN